eukprot:CAMPEP_0180118364 /NCGR_PEP_ID=MMETSP0986-20121125/1416_1 /TAXON_ID=697907 /ORGANISM="non described non described, Strain CCMP2293" /LENGTH=99 /DNA_ID=CAMNT_0022057307 /DNA_START=237 /DNA_END=533 /DNA_ORIENTATION=+
MPLLNAGPPSCEYRTWYSPLGRGCRAIPTPNWRRGLTCIPAPRTEMGCVTLRLAAWDPSRFFLEVEQQPKISSILAPPASTSQPQDPILQPGRTRSTPT